MGFFRFFDEVVRLTGQADADEDHVTFYVLESAGAEGGKAHRAHHFSVLCKDPENIGQEMLRTFVDYGLKPVTRSGVS